MINDYSRTGVAVSGRPGRRVLLSETLGLRVDWSACVADWPRTRLVTVGAALPITRELAKILRLSIVANQDPEM